MRTTMAFGVAAAVLLSGTAFAQTAPAGDPALRRPQAAESPADRRAVLSRLAHDVMAAQQMGYLAADKNMQASYALLGDQMALVNSQLNQNLDRLAAAGNLDLPRVMDQQDRQRFERMKNQNQEQFARNLVGFVNDVYPRILAAIDALGREMPDSPVVAVMARDAAPRLREQMQTAQQLAQGNAQQQNAKIPNRGPIQRKDDPSVIPDAVPGR